MSKRLLVVDDEPNLLRAVEACLRAQGYEVTTARGGREALARVAQTVPDLVVSDIRMPGMDGYRFAQQLRASPRTALVPVVFLTAKDETADRIEGFRSGVDAYVTKPFEPDELIAVIKRYPQVGYWVAYSRTARKNPITTVTMQQIPTQKPQ